MSLDLNNIEQFSQFMDRYFFYPFYEKLSQVPEESSILSWTSPAIGIADGIASSVQAIGSVAETAIKGTCNLAKGGINCDVNPLKIGSFQVLASVGIGTLSIPIILFRTLRITRGMMLYPKETSEIQAENYRKKIQNFTTVSSAQV